jgi:hypothetical protein
MKTNKLKQAIQKSFEIKELPKSMKFEKDNGDCVIRLLYPNNTMIALGVSFDPSFAYETHYCPSYPSMRPYIIKKAKHKTYVELINEIISYLKT